METKEMVDWLRRKAMVAGGNVEEKAMFGVIAARLEDRDETCRMYERTRELAESRVYRKKYVEYWRKKKGKSELSYPDFDSVYEEWWGLLNGNKEV